MIKEITGRTEFEGEIKDEVPVLADFHAKWCGPCKMQSPILYEFAESMGNKVKIIKIDVDENADISEEYRISSIPTLVVFAGGEEKSRHVGLASKAQLSDLLIKYL